MDEQLISLWILLFFLILIVLLYIFMLRKSIGREKNKVEEREKGYDAIFEKMQKKFGGELWKEESPDPLAEVSYSLTGKYRGIGFSLKNADIRRFRGYFEALRGLRLSLEFPLDFKLDISYEPVFEYPGHGYLLQLLEYKLSSISGARYGWFFIRSSEPDKAREFCDKNKEKLKKLSVAGDLHSYLLSSIFTLRIKNGKLSFFFAADGDLAIKLLELAADLVKGTNGEKSKA